MRGTVNWFDAKKGYGFIKGEDEKNYFVHYSSVKMEGYKILKENQTVEFESVESDKGFEAKNVTVVE